MDSFHPFNIMGETGIAYTVKSIQAELVLNGSKVRPTLKGNWTEDDPQWVHPFNRSTEECGRSRLHHTSLTARDGNKNRHLNSVRAGWEEGSKEGEEEVDGAGVTKRSHLSVLLKSNSYLETCSIARIPRFDSIGISKFISVHLKW